MVSKKWSTIFTPEKMKNLFPEDRSNSFFDALFGDPEEGAYDISLTFRGEGAEDVLDFAFVLEQRPGKCLVCSLTYGLPDVFMRHPVINVKGLVSDLVAAIGENAQCKSWELGPTREISRSSHEIPLRLTIVSGME
ncbi:pancreas/duodenum homeobox protein 1 [Desulfobotulus sp. H1]|uniref:Pancreas/duodenum homeobox protein 1 n=1 Tax=Desulfobotulus pelophilus TaxID=2823377 RepID=A0ABT3NA42_9BACT|nr:pancreas/duodenum homeobox protein 1 [Desulfobotulus pelophilus]MCW7754332.1 pancreas/duodenum homeobox protein 1 [Desulfobotulus pelophilus]